MADPDEVAAVQQMLNPVAGSEGWNEAKIGELLDAGETPEQIALAYWESRMARTSNLVDVQESGSSRRLSDIHKSAAAMAKYYADKVAGQNPLVQKRPVRTRPIVRR